MAGRPDEWAAIVAPDGRPGGWRSAKTTRWLGGQQVVLVGPETGHPHQKTGKTFWLQKVFLALLALNVLFLPSGLRIPREVFTSP